MSEKIVFSGVIIAETKGKAIRLLGDKWLPLSQVSWSDSTAASGTFSFKDHGRIIERSPVDMEMPVWLARRTWSDAIVNQALARQAKAELARMALATGFDPVAL